MIDNDKRVRLAALQLNAAKANLEEDVNKWVTESARLDDDDVLMTFSAWINSRTRSRKPPSIGSNQLSKR